MIKALLVGKEIADDTKKGELFAGTSGHPALRYLLSKLAGNTCGEERKCVRVMDVKSAFFFGRVRRPINIQVSREDRRSRLCKEYISTTEKWLRKLYLQHEQHSHER